MAMKLRTMGCSGEGDADDDVRNAEQMRSGPALVKLLVIGRGAAEAAATKAGSPANCAGLHVGRDPDVGYELQIADCVL
jgi:hypothetical protein